LITLSWIALLLKMQFNAQWLIEKLNGFQYHVDPALRNKPEVKPKDQSPFRLHSIIDEAIALNLSGVVTLPQKKKQNKKETI